MKIAHNRIDLVGQKFGKLLVTAAAPSIKSGKTWRACWTCHCDCGNTCVTRGERLKNGQITTCGCSREIFKKDIRGQKFGRLLVLELAGKSKNRTYNWRCRCDCGEEIIVRGDQLRDGHTQSCGCFNQEQREEPKKHGHSINGRKSKTYGALVGAKSRCYNSNNSYYPSYGGRGIKVCQRWLDEEHGFENFLVDMGECPSEELSLDRINNDGNYEPENCRWATIEEQSNNKRTSHFVTYNGETKTLTQWCRILGIKRHTLDSRLRSPLWSVERAFTTPVKNNF
jgi:hypothetical protein